MRGQPTRIDYPDGTYELFKYDTEGNLHRSFNKERVLTIYDYDYLGRLLYSESKIVTEGGDIYFYARRAHQYNGFRCIFDKYGYLVKHYTFNPMGRISKILEQADFTDPNDPESRCTEFTYDSLGRVASKKVWFGTGPDEYALECFKYHLLGYPLEKRIENASGRILLRKRICL